MRQEYIVYGTPAPQGSKRHIGNGRMVESSKAVKPWREAIVWQVKASGGCFDGPVAIDIYFTLDRPKSAPKSRTRPTVKPDIDKLVRSTLDGLKTAGVYRDDSQVVELLASKRYALDSYPALDRPGARIKVMPL